MVRHFQSWRLANSDFGYISDCLRFTLHGTLADLCQSSSIICSGSQMELIISTASATP